MGFRADRDCDEMVDCINLCQSQLSCLLATTELACFQPKNAMLESTAFDVYATDWSGRDQNWARGIGVKAAYSLLKRQRADDLFCWKEGRFNLNQYNWPLF